MCLNGRTVLAAVRFVALTCPSAGDFRPSRSGIRCPEAEFPAREAPAQIIEAEAVLDRHEHQPF
jgi:hypothetical protein